jgi:hypothetical protein
MERPPLHIGLDETLSAFDDLYRDGYAYAVLDSRPSVLFQFTENDIEGGKALFTKMMTKYAESGNCSIFLIRFYPMPKDGKFLEPHSKCISTTPVRLNDLMVLEVGDEPLPGRPYMSRQGNKGDDWRMFEAVQTIKDLPAQIDAKIDKKFSEIELRIKAIEEMETEPEADNSTMGQIGRLMENPGIAQLMPGLIGAVTELLSRFMPPKINAVVAPKAISGTEPAPEVSQESAIPAVEQIPVDEEVMNQAINRLNQVCRVDTDLMLLADFAETQPVMFQMMLANLRSQNKAQ